MFDLKLTSRLQMLMCKSVGTYFSLFLKLFLFKVGIKAMPHNRNTFIERDSFNRFISSTQVNPAVSQHYVNFGLLFRKLILSFFVLSEKFKNNPIIVIICQLLVAGLPDFY
jgi:hypothetical protein